jgi:hypothetical protein
MFAQFYTSLSDHVVSQTLRIIRAPVPKHCKPETRHSVRTTVPSCYQYERLCPEYGLQFPHVTNMRDCAQNMDSSSLMLPI